MNRQPDTPFQPGLIVLLGSGETSPGGRKILDHFFARVAAHLPEQTSPCVALLETPAGFELNSAMVAGRVADFMRQRLQNYTLRTEVIPARKRDTPYSPDLPEISEPLLEADVIFMGPGSPTYAVRQLKDSLAWHYLTARHRLGAALIFASAAVIAAGAYSLPVYEIYKVGEEVHWKEGLDLFGAYGLSLALISHWNNQDGGDELDTSRCFMGQSRFELLYPMLPPDAVVLGIDENTALIVDIPAGSCEVMGQGGVVLIRRGEEKTFQSGRSFGLGELGPFRLPDPKEGLPDEVWQKAVDTLRQSQSESSQEPPREVLALLEKREAARADREWIAADALREQIEAFGWQVMDTPEGPRLRKQPPAG